MIALIVRKPIPQNMRWRNTFTVCIRISVPLFANNVEQHSRIVLRYTITAEFTKKGDRLNAKFVA